MIEFILIILCIIGDFLDSHSTYVVLRNYDKLNEGYYEANPIFNWVFNKIGVLWGCIIGFILGLILIYFISNSILYMIIFIILKYSVAYGNYTGKQPLIIELTTNKLYDLLEKIIKNIKK